MDAVTCRLLIDTPARGDWNMAVDEMLLQRAAVEGEMAWRFYGWNEPTVSLGYFQDYQDRFAHPASRLCPAVRRLTGGGTILHDRELTYSLAIPASCRWAADRDRLYSVVHRALIAALGEWKLTATIFCPCDGQTAHDAEFLCFQRRTPGDVVLGGMKIGGSAQRRRRGAVLQHGSVLLGRSSAAPELPGLVELTGIELSTAELVEAWLPRLTDALNVVWRKCPLDTQQRQQAERLMRQRYSDAAWTERRAK
jgi:lipoate-protein ligase A